MDTITIALDWTFNANHLGFIIAQELEIYKKTGLHVNLITPDQDNYSVTPAKKVELAQADFALCPLESIISYQTKSQPFPMLAVAAIFKTDLSAIACKKNTASRPADLDGKSYASYKARYEDAIVKQMLRNDGGTGNLEITYPDKLGIWDTIENGSVDSTWIFLNWEALEAKTKHLDLSLFQMRDYDIPYSYSPVVALNETLIDKNRDAYSRFLKATAQGWQVAQDDIELAAKILKKYAPPTTELDFKQSVQITNEAVGSIANWGKMDFVQIDQFLNWLQDQQLESEQVTTAGLFTNDLLS
jgi:ABC-type nitrate/sulfonate/bicarbonate transport system substrate-binding protein